MTRSVDPYPATFSSHDHGLVLAETSDVGSDDRVAGVFERSLLCRLDSLWQDQQQQQVLRNFRPGVCRSVEGRDGDHIPPRPRLADLREVRRGIIRVANRQHATIRAVAKASTASKIDFGTPQACLLTSVDSAHDSHGTPIDRDQPAELFPPGPRLLLAIDRDAARKAAPAMSPADERHRSAWTCLVVGSCRCKRVFSLVSSHHPTAREAP